jgi:NifU-like protein involved in Fe-S cluster formation
MSEDALYHAAILDRARGAAGAGPLAEADGRATVDNPLCGDRVTIEVRREGGRIAAIGHRVRGCLLCEASAALIADYAPGRPVEAMQGLADAVAAMLREGAPPPWPDLAIFAPVARAKSRHDCVLLPFRALAEALVAS